jgi:hypothetical protein
LVRHYVDSYESVHQEERLLLLRDREPLPKELAEELEPQARDLEIIRALWRYRFLLTSQIAREWWPGKSLWATQKRLRRLTAADWVSRFRPRLSKGKHEWVYELARKASSSAATTDPSLLPRGARDGSWVSPATRDRLSVAHAQARARRLLDDLAVDVASPLASVARYGLDGAAYER